MKWDLTPLYLSFDDPNFVQDLNNLKTLLADLESWSKEVQPTSPFQTTCEYYLRASENIRLNSFKLVSFCSLTFSTDTSHTLAMSYMTKIQKEMAKVAGPKAVFLHYLKAMGNTALDEAIKSSPLIQEHAFHLKELLASTRYLVSEKEEVLLARMKQTGSMAWSTLQGKLSSQLMVDMKIDGKPTQLPLQTVRNYAFKPDPALRKSAFEAELKAYKKIEEASCACLNAIKGEVLTEVDLRGFESVLDKTLFDARLSKTSLEAMMTAINTSLPKVHAYYKRKARLLGHTKGLPMYDLNAPIGESSLTYTYDEAKAFVLDNFASFSPSLATYAQKAFDGNWIDVEPKQGKRGGAFCSNIPSIKQSRILMNFTGSLNNVITLAHELGHGYHGEQVFKERPLNAVYTMPIAETASIFCETIVKHSALNQAPASDKLAILEASIQGYAGKIVDIYSRFLFETDLFDKRKDTSLSVDEVNAMMVKAQKAAYGDSLDPTALHSYMWINKVHYYYAERNFYNFPYTFGLLFALGLYDTYQKEGDAFITKYDVLLQATGKLSIEDVAKLVDIDITTPDFWMKALGQVAKEIDTFLALTE